MHLERHLMWLDALGRKKKKIHYSRHKAGLQGHDTISNSVITCQLE